MDKNKHKDVIHFLLNKPFLDFKNHVREFREKCHAVYLSQDIQIHYILRFNSDWDKIEEIEMRLWKKCQLLNRTIYDIK